MGLPTAGPTPEVTGRLLPPVVPVPEGEITLVLRTGRPARRVARPRVTLYPAHIRPGETAPVVAETPVTTVSRVPPGPPGTVTGVRVLEGARAGVEVTPEEVGRPSAVGTPAVVVVGRPAETPLLEEVKEDLPPVRAVEEAPPRPPRPERPARRQVEGRALGRVEPVPPLAPVAVPREAGLRRLPPGRVAPEEGRGRTPARRRPRDTGRVARLDTSPDGQAVGRADGRGGEQARQGRPPGPRPDTVGRGQQARQVGLAPVGVPAPVATAAGRQDVGEATTREGRDMGRP